MNASVVSDLQTAILNTDPASVRKVLDLHTNALRHRPSCPTDGWSPLHVLAKAGEDYMTSHFKRTREKKNALAGNPQAKQQIQQQQQLLKLSPNPNYSSISASHHQPPSTKTLDGPTSLAANNNSEAIVDHVAVTPHPPTPPPPWFWAQDIHLERYHRARMAIVYMLSDAGVDVNGRDASGMTPLHYAARRGDAAVCEVLLQCGADLFAPHDGIALWDEVERAARMELKEQPLSQINPTRQIENGDLGMEEESDADDDDDENETTGDNNDSLMSTTQQQQQHQHHQYHFEPGSSDYTKDYCYNSCDNGGLNNGVVEEEEPEEEEEPVNNPAGPAGAVRRIFRFYYPGLWRAVAMQNISKVRQLVNSWCRVDLSRGGMTIRELAVGTGNESIINLLLSIQPSMNLVHHSLAGNLPAVKDLLESPSRKKINIDIRKLSERGAPLLYFLIRGSQYLLIQELRRHGASLYTQMLDDSMLDIPVIFTALEPWMEPEVVKSLLPDASSREARLLQCVWNRGKNVLRVAVENDIHVDAIKAIIEVGGAALLCERDPDGLTVVDMALKNHQHKLVALMDQFVALWLTRPDLYPRRRDLLALRGFGRLEVVAEAQDTLDQDATLFLQEYRRCQGVLQQMFRAIEEGETTRMQQLIHFESDIFYLVDLLWQGRLQGDGMPLLHWAVLHSHQQIVNLILRSPLDHPAAHDNNVTTRFCPDDVRDQWRRTPLHYACGLLEGANAITPLLLDLGSSEHTLDMDGREPLDFRDARGSQALMQFMDNIRNKVQDPSCPDPWDPEILRIHLDNQRRERFQNLQPHHHHHPHHLYHHHLHQSYVGYNTGTPYSPSFSPSGPPFQYGHAHPRDMGISGWTYPAQFPTSPGSNFQWPLPHFSRHSMKEEKGGQRLCCIM